MRKHVRKLLNHQCDILPPQAVAGVRGAMEGVKKALDDGASKTALRQQMENLELAANKWLKPYPNAAWRENIEVLLVALTVAMGIRTFFLQPFKIPTGSMQPTLFGVTSEPDFSTIPDSGTPADTARSAQAEMEKIQFSSGWEHVREWFAGVSRIEMRAKTAGELDAVNPALTFSFLRFSASVPFIKLFQTLVIGGKPHRIWLPPDYGGSTLQARAGLRITQFYNTNDLVVRMKIATGDHLFVDRVTYNFRTPQRGDIVVFPTSAIPEDDRIRNGIPPDQFYIKRLVGLGGENLSIAQDFTVTGVPRQGAVPVGHLVINGQPLSAKTYGFEEVYSFLATPQDPKPRAYKENCYFGHAMLRLLSSGQEYHIEPGHAFVMGDNTLNSLDSRFWGDFPESAIVGRACFVYWPFTKRFGFGYH